MLLDDAQGCPGQRSPIRNRVWGLCLRCARFGGRQPHIQPQARRESDGHLSCAEVRLDGGALPEGCNETHRVTDTAPDSRGASPLEVGGGGR
jgi:hypothetical protein